MADNDISFWIDDRPAWRRFEVGDEIDIVSDGQTIARARVTSTDRETGSCELVTFPLPKSGG
jgi:hypothetical protein